MRFIAMVLTGLFGVVGVCGCDGGGVEGRGVKVDIEGGGKMPAWLGGTWASEDYEYGFTFEPNGVISVIKHPILGLPVTVAAGGGYEELLEDGYAYCVLGECKARYNPRKQLLSITVVFDKFYMKLPIGIAEGSIREELSGEISADRRVWTAKGINFNRLEGAAEPSAEGYEMNAIVFRKLK